MSQLSNIVFQCLRYTIPNMSDTVYGLTLLVWTLVPFPKDCLHSLFWNDKLKTNTLAIVYSIWCIPKFGVKQFNWIWDQSTFPTCPCHYDTMTYWLLIWSLLCLIKQLRDSELSNVSIPPASFTIKYLNIHFLLKSHKVNISKLCFFFFKSTICFLRQRLPVVLFYSCFWVVEDLLQVPLVP